MAGQRFEGRNIEEALEAAASAFGVEAYQIDYHIVVEKRGFLGGIKRMVIEASPNLSKEAPVPKNLAMGEPAQQRSSGPRARSGPRQGGGREGREGRGGGREGGGRGRRSPRDDDFGNRVDAPRRSAPVPFDEIVPEQGEQSDAEKKIARWCTELFDHANLELEVRTRESAEQIDVLVYGTDGELMVDRGGELLDSLQVLANKALVGDLTEKKIEFDCRDFKGTRANQIAEEAVAAARKVLAEKREILLPAMTPIERRLVHVAVQDLGGVTTVSRGDGFFKRVAIIPDEAKSATDDDDAP
ncbi:MAG TPA: R3H domain-containing nucleic acid-binding protein [Thermoanaerobaculia bacterium]|nr:R3H domain-containing nucleic acid-binding protein [Thermoanaerobaculia bacterium]